VKSRIPRLPRQRTLNVFDRFRQSALLLRDDTHQVHSVGMMRVDSENPSVTGSSVIQSSLLVKPERFFQ
jgi:hypothetical protein